jgi:hypothetical protein
MFKVLGTYACVYVLPLPMKMPLEGLNFEEFYFTFYVDNYTHVQINHLDRGTLTQIQISN